MHKSNRCEARHRCGYLFIYYHNEAALLGLFRAYFSTSPLRRYCGHFLASFNFAARERPHTLPSPLPHLLSGTLAFFPATISCSISVWLFFPAPDPPPLCASIMPLFALIMCPLGVGAASGSLMPLSAFAARLPFCHFSSVDFAKIHQRQRERQRERRWGRKIFATSQSCLVVSSPGPM